MIPKAIPELVLGIVNIADVKITVGIDAHGRVLPARAAY
jgi:hypothetical protein